MRTRRACVALVCLAGVAANASPPYSQRFSDAFKASVDRAMQQPTAAGRTRLLIQAMHHGSDDEVFFVFPLLFPLPVLDGAQNAHVCGPEIRASLENSRAFVASTPAAQKTFPAAHAEKIRSDTDRLIRCLDRYYADGQLRFPPARSGNSS